MASSSNNFVIAVLIIIKEIVKKKRVPHLKIDQSRIKTFRELRNVDNQTVKK